MPRISITARLMADLLATSGANRVLTMDLHSPQIQGFFSIPADQLTAVPAICDRLKEDDTSNTVVVAAGAWSPEVATLAGVKLPNEPHRHEILSTEPLKPFLGPLVSVLDSGLYFSQSMRGEIVGGMGDPLEPAAMLPALTPT